MAYIPKTNIVNGNTIQTSDITNIIDSLNQTGSYSVIATGSFSGSLIGTSSVADQILTQRTTDNATFYPVIVDSNNNPANYESLKTLNSITFNPNDGSIAANVLKGFYVDVISINGTGTASLNCNAANFFTLTTSGSSVHISASNGVNEGQTINLLITQGSPTSSVSFSGQFYYSSGSFYTASLGPDILTFISFTDGRLYSSNINKLQSY